VPVQGDERRLRVVVGAVPVAAQEVRGAPDGVAARAEVRVELLVGSRHLHRTDGPVRAVVRALRHHPGRVVL
jgi:hypothetical protein